MAGEALRARTVALLDYDPELGRALASERLAEARERAVVTMVRLPRGRWSLGALVDRCPYGVLVLDGLLSREVALGDTVSMQLLGRGDLTHPSDDAGETLISVAVEWHVLEPCSIALLDERFLLAVRRWPEIVAALFERVATQAERMGTQRALCQLPRVEDRIHALLWFLAERWGRITPQGVIVPLRLTHDALGRLVGAKRPTVSLAVKSLEASGSVHRRADGAWLLDEPLFATAAPAREQTTVTAVGAAGFVQNAAAFPAPRQAPRRRQLVAVGGDEPGLVPPHAVGALPLLSQRIERMRGVHARARHDVEATLARSLAARARSAELRERIREERFAAAIR